jgi:hypothetical protein
MIMNHKKNLSQLIRGWHQKEPRLRSVIIANPARVETKAELDRKMRKAGWIANSVIYLVFGGFYFLVAQPYYHYHTSLEVTVSTLSTFLLTLAVSNLAIYRHYKQQMQRGGL